MGNARGSLIQKPCPCGSGDLTAFLGYDNKERKTYRSVCRRCHRHGKKLKVSVCQWPGCTFVIEDSIQLEVDHKDGNRANNDPNNVWTLCCNHHALKTKIFRDGSYRFKVVE